MIPIENVKAKRRNNPNPPKVQRYSRGRWLASQGTLIKNKKPNARKQNRLKNKLLKVWLKSKGVAERVKTHDKISRSMICCSEFKQYWQAIKAKCQ